MEGGWYKVKPTDKLMLTIPSEVLVRVFVELLLRENYINNATYLNAMRELDRKEGRRK